MPFGSNPKPSALLLEENPMGIWLCPALSAHPNHHGFHTFTDSNNNPLALLRSLLAESPCRDRPAGAARAVLLPAAREERLQGSARGPPLASPFFRRVGNTALAGSCSQVLGTRPGRPLRGLVQQPGALTIPPAPASRRVCGRRSLCQVREG